MSGAPPATEDGTEATRHAELERPPRCRVSLHHYRRATAPFAPSGLAVAGALEIYLEGRRHDDVRSMLFGLSVLRSATAEQVEAALAVSNAAVGDDAPGSQQEGVASAFTPFMDEKTFEPRVRRTLDRFGGASRCLLRLWENEGHLSPSEEEYLGRFEEQFPHWETRPGELDVGSLAIVARALGFAGDFQVSGDYDAVLAAHQGGGAVLVAMDKATRPTTENTDSLPQFMVLEQIDEEGFRAWCPFESGASDVLPRADRRSWSRRHAVAFVLPCAPAKKPDQRPASLRLLLSA
jgi:hypothetical protein